MFTNKKYLIVLLTMLGVALGLRLLNFQQMKIHNPIFDLPIVDAKEYVANADYYNSRNLIGPAGSYFHPPLYSYFVALVFKIFGRSIDAVKIIQIFIDLLNLLLIYFIARKVFDPTIALVSSGLYALYVPIIQFSVEILPPILMIFLLLSSILALLSFWESQTSKTLNPKWLVVSGASFGLLIVTLTSFILCLPIIIFWLWLSLKKDRVLVRLRSAFLFAVISLAPAGMATLRNYLHAREFVVVSYNGGINFYIGNNPDIHRTISLRPGMEYEKLVMLPYEEAKTTNFAQQSNFWYRKSLAFIFHQPIAWVGLLVKKTILFFNTYEFPRNFDNRFFTRYSFIGRLPFVKFNLILPLALCAMILIAVSRNSVPRREPAILLTWVSLGYALSIILIFIAGRYRIPVVPIMAIFAAYFIVTFIRRIHDREYLTSFKYLILSLGLAFFVQIKFFDKSYPYEINPSATYALIGSTLTEAQKFDQAQDFLQQGMCLATDNSTYLLYYHLASNYYLTGNMPQAIDFFKKSIELNPLNYRAYNELGFIYKMADQFDSALTCFNRSREIAPAFPLAYLNMADCYIGLKKWPQVISALESYNIACPSPTPIIENALANQYMDLFQDWQRASYRFERAIQYQQGLEIGPETFNRLGSCYYYLNQPAKAKTVWLKGLRLDPDYQPIRQNLELLDQGD